MRDDLSSFWWESVTGPATVVSNVVALLGEARCVALRVPNHMPWEERFRSTVVEALRRQQTTRKLLIETIEDSEASNPHALLRFALDEEARSWRSHRESLAAFLQRTKALRGLLVWVKCLDEDDARLWSEVCAGLKLQDPSDGIILIECPDIHMPGVAEVRYSSLVSEYASRFLCVGIADQTLLPSSSDARKDYTAALLSRLCGGNVELAVSISEHYLPGRDEPLDVIARIDDVPSDLMDSWHMHVWEAQLECVFPIVESERLQIVDKHAEQLDELCESANDNGLVDAFGNPIESRYDIEIGTLFWLTTSGCPYHMKLRDCDDGERSRIEVLRDCRNLLAHRRVLPEEKVRQLID